MYRWNFLFWVIILTTGFTTYPKADDEAGPYAYVVTAQWGRYYFKMSPDPKDPYDHEKGVGVAYSVSPKGVDQELWKTEGWYAFQTYLSSDGRHLIRLGNWPRGHAPSKDHLAVAFYEDGKLLKAHSTLDLIRNLSKVRPSVSHYQYYKVTPNFKPNPQDFSLITVDDIEYTFDIKTGKITHQKQL